MSGEKENIIKDLFEINEINYGSLYKEHLLNQYKLYTEIMDKTSERRGNVNNWFVAVNSALIAIMNLFLNITSYPFKHMIEFMIIVSLFGILLCFIWASILTSYKNLNEARFYIIHLIEQKLPAKIFHAEWEYIQKYQNVKNKYNPMTRIEKFVPYIIIGFYVIFILYNLYLLFNS